MSRRYSTDNGCSIAESCMVIVVKMIFIKFQVSYWPTSVRYTVFRYYDKNVVFFHAQKPLWNNIDYFKVVHVHTSYACNTTFCGFVRWGIDLKQTKIQSSQFYFVFASVTCVYDVPIHVDDKIQFMDSIIESMSH